MKNHEFEPAQPPNHTAVNVSDPALQMRMREYFGQKFDQVIEAVRRCEDIEQLAENDEDRKAIIQLDQNMKG